jgi:hypothetical protein
MVELLTFRNLSWGLITLLELVLLLYVVRQKLYRSHLYFFAYIVAVIAQSAVLALTYCYWGSHSVLSFNIAWSTQAVVIFLRWLAVIDIARRVLAVYRGIWDFAIRALFMVTAGVLVYAVWSSRDRWSLAVLTADRAEELCIATFIVFFLLFVRYYRVPIPSLERTLAIGFFLYSCFSVVNVSIYQYFRHPYSSMWNDLDGLAFLASLLLWIGAAKNCLQSPLAATPPAMTLEHYAELSATLNSRLHLLNHRLDLLFRPGNARP